MFFVDDVLLFPITGTLWVFLKIHQAVEQDMVSEAEAITAELSDLYMMLETGKITEAEFDAREQVLLDQLDQLQSLSPEIVDDDTSKQSEEE